MLLIFGAKTTIRAWVVERSCIGDHSFLAASVGAFHTKLLDCMKLLSQHQCPFIHKASNPRNASRSFLVQVSTSIFAVSLVSVTDSKFEPATSPLFCYQYYKSQKHDIGYPCIYATRTPDLGSIED